MAPCRRTKVVKAASSRWVRKCSSSSLSGKLAFFCAPASLRMCRNRTSDRASLMASVPREIHSYHYIVPRSVGERISFFLPSDLHGRFPVHGRRLKQKWPCGIVQGGSTPQGFHNTAQG